MDYISILTLASMMMAVGVFAAGIYLCRRYDCRSTGESRGCRMDPWDCPLDRPWSCCECVERPDGRGVAPAHHLVVGPTQNDLLYAPLCDVIAAQRYYEANASHDASFKLIYGKSAPET